MSAFGRGGEQGGERGGSEGRGRGGDLGGEQGEWERGPRRRGAGDLISSRCRRGGPVATAPCSGTELRNRERVRCGELGRLGGWLLASWAFRPRGKGVSSFSLSFPFLFFSLCSVLFNLGI